MAAVILIAHVMAALVVMYASFCRLSKTTLETYAAVRFAIWLMGSVAALAMVAPVIWGWRPDVFHVLILGSIGLMQIITSRQWRAGVPDRFQRSTICARH